jgi:hypothetical protein
VRDATAPDGFWERLGFRANAVLYTLDT